MIDRIDHLVLTVQDIDATVAFYKNVLGMEVVHFGEERTALRFGNQKINLHQAGQEFEPKAQSPQPGSADLCFVASASIEEVVDRLCAAGVAIIEGPVERTGAIGSMRSIYIRDPDANLIEIADYRGE